MPRPARRCAARAGGRLCPGATTTRRGSQRRAGTAEGASPARSRSGTCSPLALCGAAGAVLRQGAVEVDDLAVSGQRTARRLPTRSQISSTMTAPMTEPRCRTAGRSRPGGPCGTGGSRGSRRRTSRRCPARSWPDRHCGAGHEQPGERSGDEADDDEADDESKHGASFRQRLRGSPGSPGRVGTLYPAAPPPLHPLGGLCCVACPPGPRHSPCWSRSSTTTTWCWPGVARMLDPFRVGRVAESTRTSRSSTGRHRALRLVRSTRVRRRRGPVLVHSPRARRVVVYTWNFDARADRLACRHGVRGYLSKTLTAAELVAALEAVHAGELVISGTDRSAPDSKPRSTGDWPGGTRV